MSKKAEKANPGSAALRQQSEAQVYQNMQAEMSPPSHLLRGCLRAFWVGGLICLLAQGVQEVLLRYGFNLENVGAPTSAVMILLAVILTAAGVYDHISQFAGAGSAVPITGFANSVCSAAMEYRSEGLVLGVGGNEKSARLSGIKADQIKILVYIISGFCAAWVGMINTAQLSAAHPASGDGWEMNAIAATVLGGTSMAGGSGTILGTVVGAFVIGVINDGMTMCGVSEFWQKVIRGLVIILAVVIDQTQRNLQAKMALQARNENK